MVYSIQSCALVGLEPHLILCEVNLACQLPSFTLVGLPSSVTQESRERIRAAVTNSDFEWPARKITISLLPPNLPKWGSHFELAMALGVLGAIHLEEALEEQSPNSEILAIGELSLSGQVRPCGWLPAIGSWIESLAKETLRTTNKPLVIVAHPKDISDLKLSKVNSFECCILIGVSNLREAHEKIQILKTDYKNFPTNIEFSSVSEINVDRFCTLRNVRDEPLGVIGALVAILGKHHLLLAGPQGMGKSMLVKSICEALPKLEDAEYVERASVLHSFGEQVAASHFGNDRPVVCLQTSISRAALEGSLLNSGQVLPGELTRAHLGALVLDEFLEYRRDVIESLRQPLDEGFVRLQRAKFRTILPSKIQLLATTNLCPCGAYGLSRKLCRCSKTKRLSYQSKLSGPILDRFDLVIVVGQERMHKQSSFKFDFIPKDLSADVAFLANPQNWDSLARNFAASENVSFDIDPSEIWSEIGFELSERGKLKIAKISKTLARMLREPRSLKHYRLAHLLRQDLDLLLRESIAGFAAVRASLGAKISFNNQQSEKRGPEASLIT